MTREDVITIYAIYRRKTEGVISFLTLPIELRREWLTHGFIVGIAKFHEELKNLSGWDLVCYYHDDIME
tara:strand:- start:121 stop:327 length:207 start_codon:yes stop_codon:yes gene_type:complete